MMYRNDLSLDMMVKKGRGKDFYKRERILTVYQYLMQKKKINEKEFHLKKIQGKLKVITARKRKKKAASHRLLVFKC